MLRKSLLTLLSGITILSVNAQNSVTRDIAPFSKLYVEDRIIVRLVKSDKESALIQTQGIDESAVKSENSDNTLQLSVYGEPFTKKKVMVTLNYVNLTDIEVAGGADVTTTSLFKGQALNINLKSGGMLYLDADITTLNGKLTEGALLTAEGYAKNMDVTVSTTATVSAYDFECDTINIKVSSGGKAKIYAEDVLNAEASTKGFISFKGDPEKVIQNAISGGTIEVYKP
ncbi:MAG TPA: head GIN domain-containing protein [Bacteroidales bacterium]|jgi:hypothetical protein|nr:head GIN domain-containing protein [Bacteroidales bacterium]